MTRDDIKKEFMETRANGFVVGVPSDKLCDELIWLRQVRAAAELIWGMDVNNWRERKEKLRQVIADKPEWMTRSP